ncbi:glycosyltransferase family 4 protein [Colwellia sp. MEBiC06753]
MNILYFHQHFSTPDGCIGIRSYEMAHALVNAGHQVTIVCGSYDGGNTGLSMPFIHGKRQGNVNGITVIEFELSYANKQSFIERSKAFLSFAWHSIKVVFTEEYDVVFATTTPLTAAIPGIVAKWFRQKTFIFEVRDLWPELPKAMGVITNPLVISMLSALEWLAYKSADRHIALSPGIKQGIERHLSATYLEKHQVALIPNGCDFAIFDQQAKWQPDDINDNEFIAVFTGTHGMANDLAQVLNVAALLKERQRNEIKLVLIGQGKLKNQLIDRAKDEQLTNVVFLEPVDKYTLAKLMRRADVGLQVLANIPAFYFGTSPNKFFDYLSAGLPVINNYPGWVANLITEHQCGIAVPPDNAAAFADALITLSGDPQRCQQMAQQSLKLAKEQFSRTSLAQQFVTFVTGQSHD